MIVINYLIWNGNPELFRIGPLGGYGPVILRWYGLFFALGFLISQQLLYYVFKKESKSEKDVDTLTIYMVIATILGARLGHIFFYEPERFLANPIEIIKVWEGGLASHGAAVTILLALWIYSRKQRTGYLQILDRIVIVVALTSALIRLGNFFNSEIIGKPTDKPWGVVFINPLLEAIRSDAIDQQQIVDHISYAENNAEQAVSNTRKPLTIYIFFKPDATALQVNNLIQTDVKELLAYQFTEFFDQSSLDFDHAVIAMKNGTYGARIHTQGISRHPAQLYESVSFVILFVLLGWIWIRYKQKLPPGRLLGIFLIVCFSLRFLYEFLKENQVSFENNLPVNMGQILSIPLVLLGIFVLIQSFKSTATDNKIE